MWYQDLKLESSRCPLTASGTLQTPVHSAIQRTQKPIKYTIVGSTVKAVFRRVQEVTHHHFIRPYLHVAKFHASGYACIWLHRRIKTDRYRGRVEESGRCPGYACGGWWSGESRMAIESVNHESRRNNNGWGAGAGCSARYVNGVSGNKPLEQRSQPGQSCLRRACEYIPKLHDACARRFIFCIPACMREKNHGVNVR